MSLHFQFEASVAKENVFYICASAWVAKRDIDEYTVNRIMRNWVCDVWRFEDEGKVGRRSTWW